MDTLRVDGYGQGTEPTSALLSNKEDEIHLEQIR